MKRRYIRALAFILIFLPEPFTTPIGIVLLLFSLLLPKSHRVGLRNIEDMVKRYSSYYRSSVFRKVFNPNMTIMFHKINRNKPVLIPETAAFIKPGIKNSLSIGTTHNYSVQHVTSWHDYVDKTSRVEFQRHYSLDSSRISDKVIHHVLQTSVPQYKATPEQPIIYHSIKRSLEPPARYEFTSRLIPIKPVSGSKNKYAIYQPRVNTYNRFLMSSPGTRK